MKVQKAYSLSSRLMVETVVQTVSKPSISPTRLASLPLTATDVGPESAL